jgi:hypothetical protein
MALRSAGAIRAMTGALPDDFLVVRAGLMAGAPLSSLDRARILDVPRKSSFDDRL